MQSGISGNAHIKDGHVQLTLTVPVASGPPNCEEKTTVDDSTPRHSSDYASLRWRGKLYTFSYLQRRVIQHLLEAWENGTPFVTQAKLLEVAESSGNRLRDLFRKHPAWGVLLCSGLDYGGPVGSFCLIDPAEVQMRVE